MSIATLMSLVTSFLGVTVARQYIAKHREQTPVTFVQNLTHWKTWLAALGGAGVTAGTLYSLLTSSWATDYTIVSQTLLAAIIVLLVSAGLCLTVVDLRVLKLPTKYIYPTLLVSFILLTIVALIEVEYTRILFFVIGALASSLAMFLLWFFIPGGFGFGDVRLYLLTGGIVGWVNWEFLIPAFFISFVAMSLAYLPFMIARVVGGKTVAPFGPWIIVGALIILNFGDILTSILFSGGLL